MFSLQQIDETAQSIPKALRNLPNWVSWDSAKIPLIAGTSTRASSTDPDTWRAYSDLAEDAKRGFVITAPYCGVDLDSCRDAENEELDEWARKIVRHLDSYSEVSPSGTGVHVWVRARLSKGASHKVGKDKSTGLIEQYDSGRYFTVTGQRLGEQSKVQRRQSQIDDLDVITRIWKTESGKSLWQNRNGNEDESANDFALACKVIELGVSDPQDIERILRVSCLERDKWDSGRGEATYISLTITKALETTSSKTSDTTELLKAADSPKPIDWAEFAATDHNIGDWIAEPLLPRGTLVMLYSAPGIGKSLLSLELAAKLSLGLAFLAQSSGRPLSVVYLDSEMTESDLADRLDSLNFKPTELTNLHYYLLQDIPPLDTKRGGDAVHAICQEHKADICIIDPMVNTLKGEENESNTIKDWTRYTILPLKADGVTVLVLDHSGKDKRLGMRGSSAKKAAADVVWRMVGTGKGVRLKADKRRQGWIPEVINLVKLEEPYLSHALITNKGDANVIDAVADEVVAELNDLDIPLDTSYAKAGKLLRAAGKRHSQKAVVAAQKKRRDPNSSNKIDFEDSVAEFCRDVVLKDEEYRCSTREVHDYYRSWAADQNYEVMDLQDFANVVKRSIPGVRRRKNSNNINEWRGLKTPLLTRS